MYITDFDDDKYYVRRIWGEYPDFFVGFNMDGEAMKYNYDEMKEDLVDSEYYIFSISDLTADDWEEIIDF